MRRNNARMRRLGVAALAIVAAGAAAFGGTTAANAASGASNQGANNVVIVPSDGAINFLQDEARGLFTWTMDDGRANSVSNWSVTAGDQATYVLSSPAGLTFPGIQPNCDPNLSGFTAVCTVSENRREITITYTATTTGQVNVGFAGRQGPAFEVRAINGLWVAGQPTVTYTPFPGLTTATPSSTGYVQQDLPDSNQGVSNAKIRPFMPAVNFATEGTQGVLTFDMGNGTPDTGAPWSLMVGDESAYQVSLIESMRFLGSAPVCPTDLYSFATTTCSLSADQRTWIVESVVHTAVTDSTQGFNGVEGPNWLMISTQDNASSAPNAGTMIFTPWYTPGGNNARPGESTPILFQSNTPNDTPLLAGGIIASLTLAGAGAVYGIRRKKAKA